MLGLLSLVGGLLFFILAKAVVGVLLVVINGCEGDSMVCCSKLEVFKWAFVSS